MSPYSLRLLGVSLLSAFALASHASADLIVAWDLNNAPASSIDSTPPPWDFGDHVITSDITLHGTLVGSTGGNPMIYKGWGTTISTDNYLGFTVQAEAGYQLNLTDLFFIKSATGNGSQEGIAFAWGYRIDNGPWTLMPQENFTGSASLGGWTFPQSIVTTGTVEIGYFGSTVNSLSEMGPSAAASGIANDIALNGTVTPAAVPEPSTIGFAALGLAALAAMRRRR